MKRAPSKTKVPAIGAVTAAPPSAPHAVSTTPWPTPVDGALLLDELTSIVRKYVVLAACRTEV